MDLRSLVLGVLLPGFTGTTAPTWLLDAARDGLAGVVLFAPNTPDVATTRALTDSLHGAGPLLVAIDEESGDVSRLQLAAGSALPGAAALGAVDDVDLTRRTGAALGGLLTAAGIDLNLAPVLDVASEPRNPVIGVRSFGSGTSLVARHGAAFVTGLHDGGVAACGKHFPGHGATTADSHLVLPEIDVDTAVLRARDLPPFEAAAAAGLDAVMTAHVSVPALGPAPASLEPAVTALARSLVGGEERVVVTDALDMGAVASDGFGEACVRALEAGADLLCLGTTVDRDDEGPFRTAVAAISDAVRSGRLDPAALWRSVARTDGLRAGVRAHRHGAEQRIAYREGTARATADPQQGAVHAERTMADIGAEVARRAVRGHGRVRREGTPVLLDLRRRVNQAAGPTFPALAHALTRRRPGAHILLPAQPGAEPLADSLAAIDVATPVLVLTREPLADADERSDLEAVLAARPDAVVVHGGTAGGAPPARAVVLAHGIGPANAEAALDIVFGESDDRAP
ncbi:glycoside hydrolase family 3 N-terminal domain-containing protein [Georgenia halophila]|uniref:Glycoside hydrolase family 3 N-terminal domain-containing protein n=1 Tax=Georgenia halophila TaxID=620889 RepID=A0ABP8L506_9MICO